MTLLGERLRRRNHATGVTVVLVDGDDCPRWWGLSGSGRWATVCLTHDDWTHHRTRAIAVAWMSEPWVWCRECHRVSVESGTTHAVHLGGVKDRKGRQMMTERDLERQARATAEQDHHHDGDGCDLDDSHDARHHANDERPGSGRCLHPDCRADDVNDDRLTGMIP